MIGVYLGLLILSGCSGGSCGMELVAVEVDDYTQHNDDNDADDDGGRNFIHCSLIGW